jgi:hypothetical protein
MPRHDPGVYPMGLCLWLPTDVVKKHDWAFNKRYKCIKGKQFFDNETGEVKFTDYREDKMPRKRKTMFGPFVGMNAVIHDNTAYGVGRMLSRHFKVKIPESKADQDEIGNLAFYGIRVDDKNFDQYLRDNQKDLYLSCSQKVTDAVVGQIGDHNYMYDLIDASILLSLEPHIKMMLRQGAVKLMKMNGKWVCKLWTETVEWKMKYIEIAKANKDPRVIVDCGVENSLPRVHFANSFKEHTKFKTMIFGRVLVKYAPASSLIDLNEVFELVCNDDNVQDITIINSSDDAIICFRHNGVWKRFNVDISSNDSSHSWFTFYFYSLVSGMNEDQYQNLLAVMGSDFVVKNPSKGPDGKTETMVFKTLEGLLPSGIGDTTVSNNCVYLFLAYILNEYLILGFEPRIELLTLAGFKMGFRFSYQFIETLGDMQYLKYSPIMLKGKIMAMPNLGTLLRYSGGCEGDIQTGGFPTWTKGDYRVKCAYAQSLLTYGFFKKFLYLPLVYTLCPYYDYLSRNQHKLSRYEEVSSDIQPQLIVGREQFYSRYDVSDTDIDEFEGLFRNAGAGDCIFCHLIDVVLEKDYGISW